LHSLKTQHLGISGADNLIIRKLRKIYATGKEQKRRYLYSVRTVKFIRHNARITKDLHIDSKFVTALFPATLDLNNIAPGERLVSYDRKRVVCKAVFITVQPVKVFAAGIDQESVFH